MIVVLVAIAFTPSAPVLIPELAGSATEISPVRAAALEAAAALPGRWVAVGVGPAEQSFSRVRGSFAGYGVDVPVALCPSPCPDSTDLPLCVLVAGWLRGRVNPEASVEGRVYPADLDPSEAVQRGQALRSEIDRFGGPVGVLVVADGAIALTDAAPGGFDPHALAAQAVLDRALSAGDTAALSALPRSVVGRVAYQVLAGLTGPGPVQARELARGAPYGVGYFAGVWDLSPGGDLAP